MVYVMSVTKKKNDRKNNKSEKKKNVTALCILKSRLTYITLDMTPTIKDIIQAVEQAKFDG
jgi:hypothetical protein